MGTSRRRQKWTRKEKEKEMWPRGGGEKTS